MIPDVARYHGVVFRQLIVDAGRELRLEPIDSVGRVDCFRIDDAAIHIKYSTKRLSPWQFTFTPDQLSEIDALCAAYRPVAVVLVCGVDGVVALRWKEVAELVNIRAAAAEWIRAARGRNAQYTITGSAGSLTHKKPMGVSELLQDIEVSRGGSEVTR